MNTSTAIFFSAAFIAGSIVASPFVERLLPSNGSSQIKFNINEESSISVDATRRMIFVTQKGGPKGDRLVVCAEPSPDALVALSAQLSAKGKIEDAASGDVAISINDIAKKVTERSQTIQLLRDGTFRACEAYMNGAINEFEYSLIINHYDRVMLSLLILEGVLEIDQTGDQEGVKMANANIGNASGKVLDFLKNLAQEPRLVASCAAWYSRFHEDKETKNRDNRLDKYCDSALKIYELFGNAVLSRQKR